MKKFLPVLGLLVMLAGAAKAQDVHFSQYFTSPLTLNPAMTGLLADDIRFAANYRNQWSSVSTHPYVTGTASFDIACLKGKLPAGDALGLGVMMLYDKSGSGGLQNTTVGFSFAYHKAFGRDKLQHISIGAQADLVQKSIDFSKMTFEEQYNLTTGQFIPGMSNGEPIKTNSISYPDFNTGLMYSGQIKEHTNAYIGASYYHLTQPVESFLNDKISHPIHSRYSAYMGASFDLNEKTLLYANALYQSQESATEVVLGAAAGFIMNPGHDEEYSAIQYFTSAAGTAMATRSFLM